jgi:very-short-patch-repair endonuclease
VRNTKNLISTAETLKLREAWKYVLLKEVLVKKGIRHEFEFELGEKCFDLALPDRKILVEFDGPDHKHRKQAVEDLKKDKLAEAKGFRVLRVETMPAVVIDPRILNSLL